MTIQTFQETVWAYYRQYGRDLPWRKTADPYHILVSELMLQQTQVSRVVPKYQQFLEQFPDVGTLEKAPLSAVITVWSGLGYNRRAKYLHEAAKQLSAPKTWTLEELVSCKGIGFNTAAAVVTYAYNQAMPFIETNVRTVYIHHFFEDKDTVSDKQLIPIIVETLDKEHPREWYWALMDYGSHLKKQAANPARRSAHYAKQSVFEGSRRQIRGRVLSLLQDKPLTKRALQAVISDKRLASVLDALEKEGLIENNQRCYALPS